MKVADEDILCALLSSSTNKDAADKVGISVAHLQRRIAKPEFQKMLSAALSARVESAVNLFQRGMEDAARCLLEVINDPNTSPQTRVNAADAIIRNGMRLTEQLEIKKRLDALEDAYNKL